MRIGVDVGGTNTDAVLIDGARILASTKQPTSSDVRTGVAGAIAAVLAQAGVASQAVRSVMIGTTHFTNALVERNSLDRVGIIRLASPSGEALPPLTGWPEALVERIGRRLFLLPGGYEVDGREISPLDEAAVRAAARALREEGVTSIAVSSAFAPMNGAMEERAAELILSEHPEARISSSHAIGRLGIIERENGTILNAALSTLARQVMASFVEALVDLGVRAPLYISQNDGTLTSSDSAARYPVMTIGSGPTNSMRGAAFLTGLQNAIVMDVGGTTCDIGVLAKGFPRESSIAVDIGGVRTNFRMPDILAIGLGGGTRIHLDPALYTADRLDEGALRIGPDSTGYRITSESRVFGGDTLTASDVAVGSGYASFGDPLALPEMSDAVRRTIWSQMQAVLANGLDVMKTAPGDATIIAVGGGHFLVADDMPGASTVVRPPHAEVANAVGAAIAQVGVQLEQIVDYDHAPRDEALARLRGEAKAALIEAGGAPSSFEVVDVDEIFLSYLPGRSAQVRLKAVCDLEEAAGGEAPAAMADIHHAY
ncbi:hydantoinase/oxoprolinase family protein [Caulobacter segnis]|uniref:hydantoinase/oxoprolinase family protein n=1 Tax=Caulobacter segnis TaxID=88688 RepID=UPI0024102C21|nr:hydantoinase/oxoprolinase family protein [Caulobacter segnis]MDG2523023.1 hydantoinase/oxoprolinase family protein [Caulobacter segnis]